MVARIMELVNATRKAIDSGADLPTPPYARPPRPSRSCCPLVAPYTAEEMWERLGHEPTVSRAGWPGVDESLLVDESVTCVVQIKGKVRARLEVAPDISETDLEAAALADPAVVRALDGATVRKVIVRAPKLVNLVV
jgi:leucyl-tRNA synthetase